MNLIPNPRILIVEDEKTMATILSEQLKKYGAEIRVETNGRDGVRATFEFDPDLVIADLNMPLLRGDEMVKEVRNKGFKKPIIILTGYGDEELMVQALAYDVFDFLDKPVPKEIFNAIVQKALRHVYTCLQQEAMIEELQELYEKAGGKPLSRQELEKRADIKIRNSRKNRR